MLYVVSGSLNFAPGAAFIILRVFSTHFRGKLKSNLVSRHFLNCFDTSGWTLEHDFDDSLDIESFVLNDMYWLVISEKTLKSKSVSVRLPPSTISNGPPCDTNTSGELGEIAAPSILFIFFMKTIILVCRKFKRIVKFMHLSRIYTRTLPLDKSFTVATGRVVAVLMNILVKTTLIRTIQRCLKKK